MLLSPRHGKQDWLTRIVDFTLGWFFSAIQFRGATSTAAYISVVGKLLRVPILVLGVYGVLLWLTYWGFHQLPSGFIPSQDKGYLVASVQMPDATSAAERTSDAMAQIEQIIMETPGVKNVEFRRRQLLHAQCLWIELWFDVHHPPGFRRAPDARPVGRRHSGLVAETNLSRSA